MLDARYFSGHSACVLNPMFGASELVGGADADIVLGDTLIEIKTTKYFEVKREWFHQLLGYWLLDHLEGIEGLEKSHQIGRLGIYFSRYGHLWTFKVSEVVSERRLPVLARWFVRCAKQEFQ